LLAYVPEQYICINWVKRHCPDVNFQDYTDFNSDAIIASKNILYNNFIFIGPYQSGIWSKKHSYSYHNEYSDLDHYRGLITYKLFQKRYTELCDKNYVPIIDKYEYLYKVRRDSQFLIMPFKYLVNYCIKFVRTFYYAGKFTLCSFKAQKQVYNKTNRN
jgi:hypothetical protein